MAAIQQILKFPLLSLPVSYHLLVISYKNDATAIEGLMLFLLLPDLSAPYTYIIDLPKTKAIQPITSPTDSLIKFDSIFAKETKGRYSNDPIRRKFVKAFEYFSKTYKTLPEIKEFILQLSKKNTIHLLNVKTFENQFDLINFDELTIRYMKYETSIKSLHHIADLLHKQIENTNMAIYNFLDNAQYKRAAELHWSTNDLMIKYDMEQTTKSHARRIFQEAKEIPHQLVIIKKSIKKILKSLDKDEDDETIPRTQEHHHFITRCFIPLFDQYQELLSPQIKDRICKLYVHQFYLASLNDFRETLDINFCLQIYADTSDDEII